MGEPGSRRGPAPGTLEIRPVESRRDRSRFVAFPWKLYPQIPGSRWVPPLRAHVRKALDVRRNPFYDRADLRMFLALRGGREVGRIAAIHNRAHNDFHRERVGFFGFFECHDDHEAAAALFEAAGGWLAGLGLGAIRGPTSPSTNHECGLLVRGFRHQPTIMTPWNPRYYADLLLGAGLAPVRDLLAYFVPLDPSRWRLPDRFGRIAERARERQGVVFRDLDLGRFGEEVATCWEIYNSAWEANWGFVPMTEEEFRWAARDLKHLLVPRFAFIAEVGGVPVGFMLIVPDFNHVFRGIRHGRLTPLSVLRIAAGKRKLRSGRIVLLGVREGFRSRSIFPVFAHEAYRRGVEYGAIGVEASWILEENEALNRPLRDLGARVYRRWRIFEGPLAS